MDNYESKAIITTIRATSRASVNIRDNFFTLEYGEERQIPDADDVDIQQEREALWEVCNSEVDYQIEDIWNKMHDAR